MLTPLGLARRLTAAGRWPQIENVVLIEQKSFSSVFTIRLGSEALDQGKTNNSSSRISH